MKKQATNAYRKLNWYKKAPSVRERERHAFKQQLQVTKPKFMLN